MPCEDLTWFDAVADDQIAGGLPRRTVRYGPRGPTWSTYRVNVPFPQTLGSPSPWPVR
jgi:hypothetical protein